MRLNITSPIGERLGLLPGMRLGLDLQRLSWLNSYSIVNKCRHCFDPEMSSDPLMLIWVRDHPNRNEQLQATDSTLR